MTRHEVDQSLTRAARSATLLALVLLATSCCSAGLADKSSYFAVGPFGLGGATIAFALLLDVRRPWTAIALASSGGLAVAVGLVAGGQLAVLASVAYFAPIDPGIAGMLGVSAAGVALGLAAPGVLVIVRSIHAWRSIQTFKTGSGGGFEPVVPPPVMPAGLPPAPPGGPPA